MKSITVETTVNKDLQTVWDKWTGPKHITKWNFASDDWESPSATNDLRVGGNFTARMAAKDGSAGFDFGGTYTEVTSLKSIAYTMGREDGRKVSVIFTEEPDGVHISETFDLENENPEEMQRSGWQAILNNFKKYVENSN